MAGFGFSGGEDKRGRIPVSVKKKKRLKSAPQSHLRELVRLLVNRERAGVTWSKETVGQGCTQVGGGCIESLVEPWTRGIFTPKRSETPPS